MCCVWRNFKYFITLIWFFSELSEFTHSHPERRQGFDKTKGWKRTTVRYISRPHYCDYFARPCMHSYVTGKICSRTVNYHYQTFENYCMMEYVNCRENYEVWQMVYAAPCFEPAPLEEYIHYAYHDDFFLDNYYVIDDKVN